MESWELSEQQTTTLLGKLLEMVLLKGVPDDIKASRLIAWTAGYLGCHESDAQDIIIEIGDNVIQSWIDQEAMEDMNRKSWSLRIQYFKDGTLLTDIFESYTLDQAVEKLRSYMKDDIELQAVRMVRI